MSFLLLWPLRGPPSAVEGVFALQARRLVRCDAVQVGYQWRREWFFATLSSLAVADVVEGGAPRLVVWAQALSVAEYLAMCRRRSSIVGAPAQNGSGSGL